MILLNHQYKNTSRKFLVGFKVNLVTVRVNPGDFSRHDLAYFEARYCIFLHYEPRYRLSTLCVLFRFYSRFKIRILHKKKKKKKRKKEEEKKTELDSNLTKMFAG